MAGIRIVDLKVPDALESGTEQNVILDCDFEVTDNEPGLSVKWFYEGEVKQVYQWIPGLSKPQALGILKDNVDLEYKASSKNTTMYRALKIKNISPTLTGSYTCKVSSDNNEDVATKKMIIYKPAEPDEPKIFHSPEDNIVVCSAYELYPKPVLKMFIKAGSNATEILEEPEITETESGFYNITTNFTYSLEDLGYPTDFVCEISIPGTSYRQQNLFTYWPENSGIRRLPGWHFTTVIAVVTICLSLLQST